MKLISSIIKKYSLPLKQPLKLAAGTLSSREGLIVCLTDDNGHTGYGEIVPLPGFSRETFDHAKAEALRISQKINSESAEFDAENIFGSIDKLCWSALPSVSFGFGSALLWLAASAQNKRPADLLSQSARERISVNGLITSSEDGPARSKGMVTEGFKSIKIKLGNNSPTEDIKLVAGVIKATSGQLSLRLDMNRRYSFGETVALMEKIDRAAIEYLEEPVATFDELKEVIEKNYPVALDESLLSLSDEIIDELLTHETVRGMVLKPTLLGLRKTLELAAKVKEQNVKAVISSSFESSVGLYMLANIAAAVNDENIPAGLDTWRYFKQDFFKLPVSQSGSVISLDQKELPIPVLSSCTVIESGSND